MSARAGRPVALLVLGVTACGGAGDGEPAVLAEIELDPRATYLRTAADAVPDAAPVALEPLGLEAGDRVRIETVGAWQNGRGELYRGAAAVFSRTGELLPEDSLHRVAGAVGVDVAPAFRSWDTYRGGVPTDIPQDFLVAGDGAPDGGVTVTVPASARFLFFTARDHLFGDNEPGREGWRVRLVEAAPG